jgi:HK97 family phage prohead protease
MQKIERKNIVDGLLDYDEKGYLKVAINKVNVEDYDKDIIIPEAYTKTLQEVGPQGSDLIYHLTDHVWKFKDSFIAKFKNIYVDRTTDFVVGESNPDLKTNPHAAFMHARYINGDVKQHSIGYVTMKRDPRDKRVITELKLLEGSAVLWGANPYTDTLEAKSELSIDAIKSEIKEVMDEISGNYFYFKKHLKSGLSTEDTYFMGMQLNELYMKLDGLNHSLKELYEAKPTEPSTDTLPSPEQIQEAFKNGFKF